MNTTSTAAKAAVAAKHSTLFDVVMTVTAVLKTIVKATIAPILAMGDCMKKRAKIETVGISDASAMLKTPMTREKVLWE